MPTPVLNQKVTREVSLTQIKSIDEGNGGFKGYASAFGVKDSYGEATTKGCFLKYLQSFIDEGWIAVGHNWRDMGCGFIRAAYEDSYGLMIEIVYHSDADSQAIRTKVNERIAAGKSVKLSIGYFLRAYEVVEQADKTMLINLTEVELKEVSIVNVPANPAADVLSAKSFDQQMSFEEHADLVKTAVKSFAKRCEDRAAGRPDRKAGSELSQQNVTTIDQTLSAIDALNEVKQPLKELADRNRKGLESEPPSSPESSGKSDGDEPSADAMYREFAKRQLEYSQLIHRKVA